MDGLAGKIKNTIKEVNPDIKFSGFIVLINQNIILKESQEINTCFKIWRKDC